MTAIQQKERHIVPGELPGAAVQLITIQLYSLAPSFFHTDFMTSNFHTFFYSSFISAVFNEKRVCRVHFSFLMRRLLSTVYFIKNRTRSMSNNRFKLLRETPFVMGRKIKFLKPVYRSLSQEINHLDSHIFFDKNR
jgi:hypothetical protein